MDQIPEYEVIEPMGHFIGSTLIPRGAVIKMWGPPGPHLEPLNEAANAAFEVWYNEEHEEIDKDGRRTGKMYKPHEMYRRKRFVPAEAQTYELVSAPPRDLAGTLDLATIGLKKDTDQRPPPLSKGRVQQLNEAAPEVEILKVPEKVK